MADDIEAKVKKLRDVITRRNDARRSIIDKRFDQLLSEADGHLQQRIKQLLKLSKEKWDAAGFTVHDTEAAAKKARDRYKSALRKKNYGF